MKPQEKEPFLPFVTVDDIVNFDPERPETYTDSRFMNAVLRALSRVGTADTQAIASFLEMEEHMVNHGVRIACGFNLTYLRAVVTIKTAARMHAEKPASKLEDVADRLCPDLLQKRHNNITSKADWERIFARWNVE